MDDNMESNAPQSEQPQQTPPPSEPSPAAPTSANPNTMGMLCHLLALVGFLGVPLGNILGPLIMWLIKKDEMPFVNSQGKEALNFQISMTIYALILSPTICLAGLGIFLLIAVSIVDLVFIIIASVQASKGVEYRYPLTIRLIK